MNIWFTGDTHFSHGNVIKYCGRPFDDAHHMNKVMIENWNAVVRPEDHIYHLGDVGFCGPEKLNTILDRLNGKKFLIIGNHDNRSLKSEQFRNHFEWIKEVAHITLQDKVDTFRMTLCHYAMRTWYRSCRGSWMLYGHSHNKLPDDPNLLSIDVGVDCHNFTPISIQKVKKIMEKKKGCGETEDCRARRLREGRVFPLREKRN